MRLGTPNAKHLYDVEVQAPDGKRSIVSVSATNRDQACRIAEKAGYVVCSVNMVG